MLSFLKSSSMTYIMLGEILMIVFSLFMRKKFKISIFQIIVLMLYAIFVGIVTAFLMFYIENGWWGGQSLFGVVLFTPIFVILMSFLLKIKYRRVLGIYAFNECIMLAVMKLHCNSVGCCKGNEFFRDVCPIPLELIESFSLIIILFMLLRIERKHDTFNSLYGYYLIMYGLSRIILNNFRNNLKSFVWILPPGHFWAIISIAIGIIYLYKNSIHFKN